MVTFLSPEWIDALDRAGQRPETAGTNTSEAVEAAQGDAFVIEQRVTDDRADDVVYTISITATDIRVRPGAVDAPTITFTSSRSVAAAIAQGTLSAQAAFMNGGLRLGGDTAALLEHHRALTDLADRFESVRDRTEW